MDLFVKSCMGIVDGEFGGGEWFGRINFPQT